MIRITQIEMQDEPYEAARELRNEVLLRPIGLPDHAWEMKDKESLHFAAFLGQRVVGVVLLWLDPSNLNQAQLLQMAVEPALQGQGVGRLLVEALRAEAQKRSIHKVWCHSRADVTAFYEKLGFRSVGETFQEVGVKHQLMEIDLRD